MTDTGDRVGRKLSIPAMVVIWAAAFGFTLAGLISADEVAAEVGIFWPLSDPVIALMLSAAVGLGFLGSVMRQTRETQT